ncbi:MAG: glycosyltransferase, partial [Acetobacteraceae bacterium]|nr:glycosyltransferase [Acetobacteraceae bacterium]
EFDAARAQFAAGEIELLHIDGLHTYEAVAHDFHTWRDAVSPRRGVVLFHDTNVRAGDFGVWRLWRELAEAHPHFEFHHGHGLGVLGLGDDLPAALAALFEMQAQPERAARLRALFAARGATVRERQALAEAEAKLRAGAAALGSAKAEAASQQSRAAQLEAALGTARAEADAARKEAASQRLRAARLEAALELRAGAAPPGGDIVAAALAEEERREAALQALRAERDALREQSDLLRRQLDTVMTSISWRLTAPLRAVVRRAPSLARMAHGTARLGYWTLKGQLPARLREWRARTQEWREARARGVAPPSLPATAALRVAPPPPAIGQGGPADRLATLEHRLVHVESLLELERGRLDYALGAIEGVPARIADYHAARETPEYLAAFEEEEPLVSVCIATVNRAELLVERAIRSLQAQTYSNLEIIVVGDHTTDDTEERLARLRDRRIRFVNLPERGPYPRPGRARWQVAGSNAMNHALSLCNGRFVTHLDDDDAMAADRIATLLGEARAHRADFLWHPFWTEGPDGRWRRIGDGRFQLGQITTGSIFYHRYFAAFGWDVYAYRLDEPGDWNRLRKIKMLRPRLRFVDRPLLYHYAERNQGSFVAQEGERFLE